jgi:thiamine-phosphate pyrophosphorylase
VVQVTAHQLVPREELFARIARGGSGLAVVLRDPELDARALYQLGLDLRTATRAVGALLMVDDRIDVALAIDADGVHLGRRSVSVHDARVLVGDKLVSRSAHSLEDARRAAEDTADAVLLSPIFPSPGKGAPLGLAAVLEARRMLPDRVALIALGGVSMEEAPKCLAAGADGVASIRADLGRMLEVYASQ